MTVGSGWLRIKGDPYGRIVPFAEMQVGQTRIIDLEQEPKYRPWLKINGIGLPNYRSGWHRLENREKALVFLRPGNLAVYVPMSKGYALVVSPENPAEFMAAL
jgi:Bacterial PH domain